MNGFAVCSQHDSARVAFEDAQQQMQDIMNKLNSKGESVKKLQSFIEEQKKEALDAHKDEQVCNFFYNFFACYFCLQ